MTTQQTTPAVPMEGLPELLRAVANRKSTTWSTALKLSSLADEVEAAQRAMAAGGEVFSSTELADLVPDGFIVTGAGAERRTAMTLSQLKQFAANVLAYRPAKNSACPVPLPTPDRTLYGTGRTIDGHYFNESSMRLHGQRCYSEGLCAAPSAPQPASPAQGVITNAGLPADAAMSPPIEGGR